MDFSFCGICDSAGAEETDDICVISYNGWIIHNSLWCAFGETSSASYEVVYGTDKLLNLE